MVELLGVQRKIQVVVVVIIFFIKLKVLLTEQFQREVDKYYENKARLEKQEKEDVNHQNSDKHNKRIDKLTKRKKKDSTEDYFKQDLDRYKRRMTRLANKSISSALSLSSLMKSKF